MTAFFRRGLLLRVILNGIILLLVSAAGFIGLASILLGGQAREAERSMTDWFATEACEAYAKTPTSSVLEAYPVKVSLYSSVGERLASSTSEDAGSPSRAELVRARSGLAVTSSSHGETLTACSDGSGRCALVGGPRQKPALARLSVSVAAIVLLVAIGSIPLARSLVRPLRELVAIAARFGEGDLAARARFERTDEIGDLAVAFNAMAAKLEARLLAEKELLANISHELRTPLARVRVVLEMAREEPARAASLLGEISRDLAELEALTNDVLVTMKLDFEEGGLKGPPGLRVHPTEVDLAAVLRHSLTRAAEAHPEREFVFEGPDEGLDLRGDPALLRRLFDNLLDNAVKYSSGPVVVHARAEGDAILVGVEDDGIGIEPADLDRVFDPFFRSDRSRRRATGGTGLGLALCKRIADLHQAPISVASASGLTVVTVRLPRAGAAR